MCLFNRQKNYLLIDDGYLELISLKGNHVISHKVYTADKDVKGSDKDKIDIGDQLSLLPKNLKKTILLLPTHHLFIKTFTLPTNVRNKLSDVLKYKFLDKLPIDYQDLYHSYYIAAQTGNELTVISFAIAKSLVDDIYQVFTEKGIKVIAILPLAVYFYLYHKKQLSNYLNKNVIFFDIGHNSSNITVLGNLAPYLRGSRGSDAVYQLKETIFYLQREYGLKEPVVMVNGSEVEENDLTVMKESVFHNLFEENSFWIEFSKKEENNLNILAAVSTVKKAKKRTASISSWVLLILIILINCLILTLKWQVYGNKLQNLKQDLLGIKPVIVQVEGVKEDYQTLKLELTQYEEIVGKDNYSYLPWIKELSNIMDSSVEIERLNFKGNKLVLLSAKAESASRVMAELEESLLFANLQFMGSITTEEDGEQFKIAGDLIYDFN